MLYGCAMKKLYNFRLDATLIKQLDQLDGSRTFNVTNAITGYLHNGNDGPSVDKDIVNLLTNELDFFKGQVTFLQRENSYLSKSWIHKLFLPKPKN